MVKEPARITCCGAGDERSRRISRRRHQLVSLKGALLGARVVRGSCHERLEGNMRALTITVFIVAALGPTRAWSAFGDRQCIQAAGLDARSLEAWEAFRKSLGGDERQMCFYDDSDGENGYV